MAKDKENGEEYFFSNEKSILERMKLNKCECREADQIPVPIDTDEEFIKLLCLNCQKRIYQKGL